MTVVLVQIEPIKNKHLFTYLKAHIVDWRFSHMIFWFRKERTDLN
jgi:hypothetical protein